MNLVLSDFSRVEVFEQLPSSQELDGGLGSERSAWGAGTEGRTGRQVSEVKGHPQHRIAFNGREISRKRCVRWPQRGGPMQHPGRVWVLDQDSMSPP